MVSHTYRVARTLAAVCCESIEVSAMARRIPDVILKLQQLARPTFVDGRWRKPKISARKLAVLRKSLVVDGVWWPPRPLRDRGADKPLKLRKWERQKEERQAFYTYVCHVVFYLVHKSPSRTGNTNAYISTCTYRQKQIEENMRNMPQMVADYRKKVYELRQKTRQKKQRSDEETYLIATGKMKEEPHWKALKTNKKTK